MFCFQRADIQITLRDFGIPTNNINIIYSDILIIIMAWHLSYRTNHWRQNSTQRQHALSSEGSNHLIITYSYLEV